LLAKCFKFQVVGRFSEGSWGQALHNLHLKNAARASRLAGQMDREPTACRSFPELKDRSPLRGLIRMCIVSPGFAALTRGYPYAAPPGLNIRTRRGRLWVAVGEAGRTHGKGKMILCEETNFEYGARHKSCRHGCCHSPSNEMKRSVSKWNRAIRT
jgi:hypothetical protein